MDQKRLWSRKDLKAVERWQAPVPRCMRERLRKEGGKAVLIYGAQGRQHWSRFRGRGLVSFGHWPEVLWASQWVGRCRVSRWTYQSGLYRQV